MFKSSIQSLQSKLKVLFAHFITLTVLLAPAGDKVISQYNEFLRNDLILLNDKFKNFNREEDRLDDFTFFYNRYSKV